MAEHIATTTTLLLHLTVRAIEARHGGYSADARNYTKAAASLRRMVSEAVCDDVDKQAHEIALARINAHRTGYGMSELSSI